MSGFRQFSNAYEQDGDDRDEHIGSPEYDHESHLTAVLPMVPIDLGDDNHRIGWQPEGDLWWLHKCNGDSYRGSAPWRWSIGAIDVTSGTKHTLRKRLPVDIGGSILCVSCQDHGFINDGKWVKC